MNLTHLNAARSLQDLQAGQGRQKSLKPLSGHGNRYSMEVNGNWRLTFTLDDPQTGLVSKIDLEDLHQPGGAKRH
ncbi:type II toxin-antitoxin system RelE/ParE family toxin [Massilia sp. CCM 9029]|nr:type II toxin-antitoxin system RelE/ParE family toxin [Massilia sp. CCM 9029]MDQ1829560.1 type II toxin-antitoxin system RelE/ParE family toxin [Massilia sp. CCM 9029]